MTNNERYPFNDIHPTALIAEGVVIGKGNTIGPYCIIGFPPEWKGMEHFSGKVVIGNDNYLTGLVTIDSGTDRPTMIGNNCYFMKHSHVGHDAIIESGVTISCGAKIGGHSIINGRCNIGLNACIHQKHAIEPGCMIGMGAIVTKKLITEPFKTYAGNPAKLIGDNKNHPDYGEYLINMQQMAGE